MGLLLGFMEIVLALCLCVLITGVITQPPVNGDNANWPYHRNGAGMGDNGEGGTEDDMFHLPYPTIRGPTPSPISCSERDRCARGNNDLPFHAKNCFCDDLCQTFGDCCKDFARSPGDRRRFRLAKGILSCERRPQIYFDGEVYIVTSCPKDYLDSYVKEKCEDERAAEEFFQLPVTGTNTGVLYRNVFCAVCAGDTQVTYWTIQINCNRGPDAGVTSNLTIAANSTFIKDSLESSKQLCSTEYKPPEGMPVRKCKSNLGKCQKSWEDKKVEKKCRGPTSFVYAGLHVFKNKHCGICNFVNETYLTCEDPRTPAISLAPPLLTPPFSIHLDINDGRGVIAESKVEVDGTEDVNSVVVDIHRCPEGQVFDPFRQVCIQVFCSKGFSFFGGQCIPSGTNKPEVTSAPDDNEDEEEDYEEYYTVKPSHTLMPDVFTPVRKYPDSAEDWEHNYSDREDRENNREKEEGVVNEDGLFSKLDCPSTMQLNQTDYLMLKNESIHISSMNRIYHPGDYVIDGPNVNICTPFTEQSSATSNVTTTVVMFRFTRIQNLVSLIGIIISLTALLILFIVYMMLPPLRNLPGKCLISLVVALFLAQVLFVAGTKRTEIPQVCITLAALMHYCFLAAFLWINVLAIDICRTFAGSAASVASSQSQAGGSKLFTAYSFYAWLIPALIVGASLALDLLDLHELYRPHYGEGLCWITSRRALLALFALPLAIILFVNILLFTATIVQICAVDRETKKAMYNHYSHAHNTHNTQKERNRFILYIKLSFIMGLTWVFGFLASLTDIHVLWYVFIIFNTLQGAFICFAFACTKKVFRLLRSKGQVHKSSSSSNTRYTNCYTNSTSPSNMNRIGYSRPTYLFDGEARVIAQETSI